MKRYEVDPEDCLILKAFKDADSLRQAANMLGCDPAGLARKVQSISSKHGFLHKINNRWQLSEKGLALVAWTEESIQSQLKFLQMNESIRIASTMWFAETVLLSNLTEFKKIFGQKVRISFSVPEKGFEQALLDGSVDYVVVCHPPENPEIEHKVVMQEKWVVAVPTVFKEKMPKRNLRIDDLLEYPFINHSQMNLDLFIPEYTSQINKTDFSIDNLIGVRSAIAKGYGWSLVPKLLIDKAHQDSIHIIEIESLVEDRKVCVWWLRNRYNLKRDSTKICSALKNN